MKIVDKHNFSFWLICIFYIINIAACKKYLDAKPNKNVTVPSTLEDASALLDNNSILNSSSTVIGEASADDFFCTNAVYNGAASNGRDVYTWTADNWGAQADEPTEWTRLYSNIYFSNQVLETLQTIKRSSTNEKDYNRVKGTALFFRGNYFWEIANIYSKAYNPSSAKQDLGIPLKMSTDINERSVRSSVEESYNQMVKDLLSAIPLLPNTSAYLERPTKSAAYGLLARVYLMMGNYGRAKAYADSCLQIKPNLLDYNKLDSTSTTPFQNYPQEEIVHLSSYLGGVVISLYNIGNRVDTTFLNSYSSNDIRRNIFYQKQADGYYRFKGSYDWQGRFYVHFTGVATDEMYLTRAECNARSGRIAEAMIDLNNLARNRYKAISFIPFSATTTQDALELVLSERRKELAFRNLRWADIKRLNLEGANISITRNVDGKVYTLPYNDKRFVLKIPQFVIDQSGMPQNP